MALEDEFILNPEDCGGQPDDWGKISTNKEKEKTEPFYICKACHCELKKVGGDKNRELYDCTACVAKYQVPIKRGELERI